MSPDEIHELLQRTFDDRRLSRSERQALSEVLATSARGENRAEVLKHAFAIARDALNSVGDPRVFEWLEEVARGVCATAAASTPASSHVEAHFSPGDDCPRAIRGRLAGAQRSVEICVFTITDDRITEAILETHRRGVEVRILSDNDKANDIGSDIDRLAHAGIPVRVDRGPSHMHHKFAVIDASTLLSGSFNWTRGAALDNQENLIVTDDPRLVQPFRAMFERLWKTWA